MSLPSDEVANQVNRPNRVGTSLPTTCKRGEMFFLVGTVNKVYASFTADTWIEIFSTSGGSATYTGNLTGNVIGILSGAHVGMHTGDAYLSSAIITDAAVADGDLAANWVAIYGDFTNGAGKLKIKMKTANGTVVVGEVALA